MELVNKSKTSYEFIGRTKDNYGVQGYVEKLPTLPNLENTISVSQVGSVHAQLRQKKWYSSQNIFVLKPKYLKLINLLTVSAIDKTLVNYSGYSNYPTQVTLRNHIIQLPTKNGRIDFDFMESFVAELEAQRVAELEAYLTVTGLKDYELTEEEWRAIYMLNDDIWDSIDVVKLFNVNNTKNILARDIVPGSGITPYLCASAANNSVSSYIDYDNELKDKGNCIFIGGKTFVVSYQEHDFFSNDSHNLALHLIDENKKSRYRHLFLATCVRKSLEHKYSWGDSISNRKIQKDKMTIPFKNGVIDYEFMDQVISAVQKLVIKDVVLWTDKKIEATKKIVKK